MKLPLILSFSFVFLFATFAIAAPSDSIPPARNLLTSAIALQDEMAGKNWKDAIPNYSKLVDALEDQLKKDPTGDLAPTLRDLSKAAQTISKLDLDLPAAKLEKLLRKEYEPMGEGIVALIKQAKLTSNYQLYYCPMVKKEWARPLPDKAKTKAQNMLNPYMGQSMPACGVARAWPKP